MGTRGKLATSDEPGIHMSYKMNRDTYKMILKEPGVTKEGYESRSRCGMKYSKSDSFSKQYENFRLFGENFGVVLDLPPFLRPPAIFSLIENERRPFFLSRQ
jgi:hypothetical protein